MTHTEVLKLALEALESCDAAHITDGGRQWYDERLVDKALTAIKEALAQPQQETNEYVAGFNDGLIGASELRALGEKIAQPQQEPVALEDVYLTIIQWDVGGGKRSRRELARRIVAKYITPPQRTWVGLTDAERLFLHGHDSELDDLISVVEAKLKAKNAQKK